MSTDFAAAGSKAHSLSHRGKEMRTSLCILTLAIVQSACAGRQTLQPNVPTSRAVDAVIDEYYHAVGGYERIKAIRTRHMFGTYVEGSLQATTDIVWQRPALRRVNVHAPGFEYSEGYDGETWEYNHLTGKAVVDTGGSADVGRRGAEFDESFVDYRSKRHHVELIGREILGASPVVHLRVALNDGFAKDYYFDANTHLITAVGKAMPIHAVGSPVKTLSFYEDWRVEDGVLQPHSFVEKIVATGKVLNTLHWDRIEDNVPIRITEIENPAHAVP
jgi:hypothetical protein